MHLTRQQIKNTRRQKPRIMDASAKGRTCYAAGDYEGAVDAYSEAIRLSSDHLLLNNLDNRAACFIKLDRTKAALRDAKTMIEVMPKRSKGYIRCGKVLVIQKEEKLALKIFDRGLHKVKIDGDKERVELQRLYNALLRKMNPKKTLDPLHYFPIELAVMIFQAMSMQDRVISLGVSRPWKRILESRTELWTTLDTSSCRKPMGLGPLKAHLRRSKYTLESAIITMKAGIDTPKFHLITRTCKTLTTLRIEGNGMIGESLSTSLPDAKELRNISVSERTEASLGTVQSCIRNMQRGVDIRFLRVVGSHRLTVPDRWPKNESLQHLELRADKKSQMDIIGLLLSTPDLTTAILPNWKIMAPASQFNLQLWTHLEHLDLSNTQITHFPKLPTTIKYLILSDNPLLQIQSPSDLASLTPLPHLETLNVHATALDAIAVNTLTHEAIANNTLKRLLIGARLNSLDLPVEQEFPTSKTVEELSLAYLQLSDDHAIAIVKLYPGLRKLDMSGTNITGVAVKDFAEKGIRKLKLNECRSVSEDAVIWARSKGVEVAYAFPSRNAGAGGFVSRMAGGM